MGVKVLIIINDAPYGTEKAYNALRLARTLQREEDAEVKIFLLADAVGCALPSQKMANGYYNVARMLQGVLNAGAQVKACGTCMEARGMRELELLPGVEPATMKDLASWVSQCDRVVTF